MSCALTQGLTLPCRDSKGGLVEIYLTELSNFNTKTAVSGVLTAFDLATGKQFWVYKQIAESSEWKEAIQTSRENNSVFFEQDLEIRIPKMQASTRNEIMLLSQNLLMVIVKDRNGKYWMLGETNGMMLEPSEAGSGKAMGDFNGYTLKFKGKEEAAAQEVASGIIADLLLPSA